MLRFINILAKVRICLLSCSVTDMVAAYNFVLWLSLAVLSNAATLTRRVLHEKREHLPHTWTKRDRLDSSDQLSIHVGLAQRNLEQGEDYLLDM